MLKTYTLLKYWEGNEINGHWSEPRLFRPKREYDKRAFYPTKIIKLKIYKAESYEEAYYQFLKDYAPKPVEDKYSDGWISPTGEFYPCFCFQGHDRLANHLAYVIYGEKDNGVKILEKYHWLRFYESGLSRFAIDANRNWQVTQQQVNRLVSLAMLLKPDDFRVKAINHSIINYEWALKD